MELLTDILEAIDELIYLVSIAFSIYRGVKFAIDSWREARYMKVEAERREKKLKAAIDTLEVAASPSAKKAIFTQEDLLNLWF